MFVHFQGVFLLGFRFGPSTGSTGERSITWKLNSIDSVWIRDGKDLLEGHVIQASFALIIGSFLTMSFCGLFQSTWPCTEVPFTLCQYIPSRLWLEESFTFLEGMGGAMTALHLHRSFALTVEEGSLVGPRYHPVPWQAKTTLGGRLQCNKNLWQWKIFC